MSDQPSNPYDYPPPSSTDPYMPPMPPAPEPGASYAGAGTAPVMVAPPPPATPFPLAPASANGDGGLAITGLVFGIIAMLGPVFALIAAFLRFPALAGLLLVITIPIAIIGIVLSVVGRSSLLRRGSATAGWMLSTIALVLAIGVLLFTLAGFHATAPGRFRNPPRRRPVPQGMLYGTVPAATFAPPVVVEV